MQNDAGAGEGQEDIAVHQGEGWIPHPTFCETAQKQAFCKQSYTHTWVPTMHWPVDLTSYFSLIITKHCRNANQNHRKVPPYALKNGYCQNSETKKRQWEI